MWTAYIHTQKNSHIFPLDKALHKSSHIYRKWFYQGWHGGALGGAMLLHSNKLLDSNLLIAFPCGFNMFSRCLHGFPLGANSEASPRTWWISSIVNGWLDGWVDECMVLSVLAIKKRLWILYLVVTFSPKTWQAPCTLFINGSLHISLIMSDCIINKHIFWISAAFKAPCWKTVMEKNSHHYQSYYINHWVQWHPFRICRTVLLPWDYSDQSDQIFWSDV